MDPISKHTGRIRPALSRNSGSIRSRYTTQACQECRRRRAKVCLPTIATHSPPPSGFRLHCPPYFCLYSIVCIGSAISQSPHLKKSWLSNSNGWIIFSVTGSDLHVLGALAARWSASLLRKMMDEAQHQSRLC